MRLLLALLSCLAAAAQTSTLYEAEPGSSERLATLEREIGRGNRGAIDRFWQDVHRNGAPLVEPVPAEPRNYFVTFLWEGDAQTRNVVIFDGVAGFDAKARMTRLGDTNVWHKTYKVRGDARFSYYLSVNDPFEPLPGVRDDLAMEKHLAMFRTDPLNPRRCPATFGARSAETSWVELPGAPPRPWSGKPKPPASGSVESKAFSSAILRNQRPVWIYTPAGFSTSGDRYPLLVLFDGDRNVQWVPAILDELIAKKRIPPVVAAMIENPSPGARRLELPCHAPFAEFLAKELVPWMRENRHATADPARTVVGGSSLGGLAAVFAAMRHPEIFGNAIALSGSFWWKPESDDEAEWLTRQIAAGPKLPLHFYLEVGLMESYEMQVSTNRHTRDVLIAKGYPHRYREYDGGHSFLNWSDATANGLIYLLGR